MITVSVVAAIMYKNLGVSNTDIAIYTGSLYLPWTIKPLWAPITEMWKTKRHWVLATEFAMALSLALVALSLRLPNFLGVSLAFFWVTGFLSSTQDIAADGVYISVTTPKEQAAWVGIQGIFWNLGRVIASGILVTFTGTLFRGYLDGREATPELTVAGYQYAWMVVMFILAAMMAALGLYHLKMLPADARTTAAPKSFDEVFGTFADTIKTFFEKPGIGLGVAFILLYRSGEGFIEKIAPLFMLDPADKGGLGLSNEALGHINGSVGTIGFMAGALLGGLFAAKMTLRRSIVVLAFAMNIPHVCYNILASLEPAECLFGIHWRGLLPTLDVNARGLTVAGLVSIEKLGYGFGSVAHMLYMMQQIAPGKYRTAHYAFATSLMGLGLMIPSMLSGWIQERLGYQNFFLFVLVASIPSLIAAKIAPFPHKEESTGRAAIGGH